MLGVVRLARRCQLNGIAWRHVPQHFGHKGRRAGVAHSRIGVPRSGRDLHGGERDDEPLCRLTVSPSRRGSRPAVQALALSAGPADARVLVQPTHMGHWERARYAGALLPPAGLPCASAGAL